MTGFNLRSLNGALGNTKRPLNLSALLGGLNNALINRRNERRGQAASTIQAKYRKILERRKRAARRRQLAEDRRAAAAQRQHNLNIARMEGDALPARERGPPKRFVPGANGTNGKRKKARSNIPYQSPGANGTFDPNKKRKAPKKERQNMPARQSTKPPGAKRKARRPRPRNTTGNAAHNAIIAQINASQAGTSIPLHVQFEVPNPNPRGRGPVRVEQRLLNNGHYSAPSSRAQNALRQRYATQNANLAALMGGMSVNRNPMNNIRAFNNRMKARLAPVRTR